MAFRLQFQSQICGDVFKFLLRNLVLSIETLSQSGHLCLRPFKTTTLREIQMSNAFEMSHFTQKFSLPSLLALSLLLPGCGGGGGGDSSTPNSPNSNQTGSNSNQPQLTECPADYRGFTAINSTLANAVISLGRPNATFTFKTPPASQPLPSMIICFGIAAPAIEDGLVNLSDTYEIIVIPVNNSGASLASIINPQLEVDFDLDNVPAGTDEATMKARIDMFFRTNGLAAGQKAATDPSLIDTVNGFGTVATPVAATGLYTVSFNTRANP